MKTSIINIKPLTVNQCWQGKRFKTSKYKIYEQELWYLLPNIKIPNGKLKLEIETGLSNSLADIDNILKPFIDILQKKYNFNDRDIFEINIKKSIVKKNKEYIKWSLNLVNSSQNF